ncbi:MAG: hypothetical protein JOZ17_15955 [Acetobacteraceae bacterium]|nr:hypothetical protein [Acetobacteraceae bacterium]
MIAFASVAVSATTETELYHKLVDPTVWVEDLVEPRRDRTRFRSRPRSRRRRNDDRVERAGYMRRTRDPEGRRGVLLETTDRGRAAVGEIWECLATAGKKYLSTYTEEELAAVLRFPTEGRAVQAKFLGAVTRAATSADDLGRAGSEPRR